MKRTIRVRKHRRAGKLVRAHTRKVKKNYGATFYHVTKESLIPSIMRKGLIPQKPKSVFGDKSQDDPSAVYTFRNTLSDQIPYKVIDPYFDLDEFQSGIPAETSTLRKKQRSSGRVKDPAALLTISVPDDKVSDLVLPKSYGATELESPLKGPIPPKMINVMKKKDYIRKSGKIKSAIEDYYLLSGMKPKEQIEMFEERGPKGFRGLFGE